MRLNQSSGDLIADRRAAYAMGLAAAREHADAADVMRQALELVPDWAAGWSLLGDWLREAGDGAGALAAYQELARRDGEGIFGAALKLAALGAAPVPRGTEAPYVEALFDDYAARFEGELLGKLEYRVPAALGALIGAELDARGLGQVGRALDLGCGTGLMGERLRRRVSYLEGVDLSGEMLTAAGGKGIYDRLQKVELTAHLKALGGQMDLITAADVLNYCGALPPVVSVVAATLAPGGLFAFSVELNEGTEPMALGPTLRYRHSREAALAACRQAGLEIVRVAETALRQDRGAPVPGLLVVAMRPSQTISVPPALPFAEAETELPAPN